MREFVVVPGWLCGRGRESGAEVREPYAWVYRFRGGKVAEIWEHRDRGEFMPLLTIATADVPAADAGLGSGITNVSQQLSGAFGLAVMSTLAASHTKGLLADHHGLAASLISGYRVGFLAGAAAISMGVALAFVLLRPRTPTPVLELSVTEDASRHPTVHANLELEQEAA